MLIALPGYWFSIAFVDRIGRYWLTQMGFLMSAVWFAVLSGGYNGVSGLGPDGPSAAPAFVVVYGLTYFFANFGPNATTFLMPSEAFPTRIRSTAHGLSAAIGKLGATVGSFGLLSHFNSHCTATPDVNGNPLCTLGTTPQAQIAEGVVWVMGICVGVSLLGNVMTTLFVKETGGRELEEVDASSAILKTLDDAHAATAKASRGGGAGEGRRGSGRGGPSYGSAGGGNI
jgi:MFS transporter, PHS family, inorganic phosphate transporter